MARWYEQANAEAVLTVAHFDAHVVWQDQPDPESVTVWWHWNCCSSSGNNLLMTVQAQILHCIYLCTLPRLILTRVRWCLPRVFAAHCADVQLSAEPVYPTKLMHRQLVR